MSILDSGEYFPTPVPVIQRMLKPYLKEARWGSAIQGIVLEPSAGEGAILDYIKEKCSHYNQPKMVAIELNSEMRYVLQGKGYRVIASDFLTYDEPGAQFGLIAMNPPFSNAVDHILKAWELLGSEGDLVALCNTETIRNAHTGKRKVLASLIEEHGSVEDLGQCFQEATRSTDVRVSMIRLKKPKKANTVEFDAAGFEMDGGVSAEEFQANPLAHNNVLANLVARYRTARKVLVDRQEMQSKLDFYLDGIEPPAYGAIDRDKNDCITQKQTLAEQVSLLKARFWNTVFRKTALGSKTTSTFRAKFEEFAITQSHMDFTVENVQEMLGLFFCNREQIMLDCLIEVFDKATAYHKDNRIHWEGWKTNVAHRLNKRIILPYGVEYSQWGRFSTQWRNREFFDDLDKIIAWLSGKPQSPTYAALDKYLDAINKGTLNYQSDPLITEFFKIKVFKKGTVHIDFLDLKILEDFNRRAAQGKKWLPTAA